jgi:molybdopterin-containing oxidoreductase family iron-sulfur binding subunit
MEQPSYYRSLEQLAGTPEFRAFAAAEFPGFANVYESLGVAEPTDADPEAAGLDRRKFLALSAAALGMAGLAGCRRPEIPILPFAAVPDEQVGHVVHGKPTFYATSIPRPGGALPVLVESHDGRPTKIEGNPQHPCSLGSTDAHAQASVLDLYSPDRVMSEKYPGVMEGRAPRKWEDFDRFARSESEKLAKDKGKGFYVLTEQVSSPAVRALRDAIKDKLSQASWHSYEAIDTSEALKGAEMAFGAKLVARYRFDKAERILALDSDFLGTDADSVFYSLSFAEKRKDPRADLTLEQKLKFSLIATTSRLYVVESTYTVTGTMADHRLRLPASQIGAYLVALAKELKTAHGAQLKKVDALPAALPNVPAFEAKWVKVVAKDFAEHPGKSIIVVGPRQPAWVHALAHAINDALGNYMGLAHLARALSKGATPLPFTAEFHDPPPELLDKSLKELAADMAAGKVGTLLIVGGNPVFNAPADLRFADELQKVSKKLRLGLFFDHTSEKCDWHLPLAHFLEGWGDTEAGDGSLCCVQPLLAPLNSGKAGGDDTAPPPRGGRTVLEVLALLAQTGADGKPLGAYSAAQKAAYGFVRKAFSDRSGIALTDPNFDTAFNRYKQLGFFPVDADKAKALGFEKPDEKARKPKPVTARPSVIRWDATAPTKDALEVTFHASYSLGDGRGAMNPWLQEMPDPITKVVWDNAAVISPATAAEFGITQGDLVEVRVEDRAVTLPAFVLPGQADYSVALAFGQYGEMRISHVPQGGGTDVFPLRRSHALHTATGAKLKKTGGKGDLVTTQEHGVIPEGRDIVREEDVAAPPKKHSRPINPFEHVVDGTKIDYGNSHEPHGPKIGIPPDGHITEGALKKEFQGGYGNQQQGKAPAKQKQERFPLDLARPELLDSQFQWGMVIDLAACTGCSSCVIACQAENNIPVVGKHEVARNREMHWIRIDRYFTGPSDEPNIVSQPVACVHCEAAPCEQVCPVNAAVHSNEGLNLLVYNRCIGTRYCSNACPYKVRRFNWFDFNKRRLDELRVPTPFASGGTSLGDTGVPETLKMQKNPDVTVRMRGVMEKCTYCIQRIERGKYGAKIAAAEVAQDRRTIETDAAFKPADGSASAYKKPKNPRAAGYDLDAIGRVIVPDGVIVTACAAACPTQAITFGNTLDPQSKVAKLKARESEYLLLGELNTKPRTSYLPRVRNLNPDMA